MLTISRASIFDALCAAVDEARAKAAGSPSWLKAIDTGWNWLLEQEWYEVISPFTPHAAVRIGSYTDAYRVYTANGECQCEAYTKGKGVCWHRAASRLLRNAMDAARAQAEWEAKIAGRSADELAAELYA